MTFEWNMLAPALALAMIPIHHGLRVWGRRAATRWVAAFSGLEGLLLLCAGLWDGQAWEAILIGALFLAQAILAAFFSESSALSKAHDRWVVDRWFGRLLFRI